MYKPADYFSDSEEDYDEYDQYGFDFFSPNADKLKKERQSYVVPKVEPKRDPFLELINAGKWNKVIEKLETEDLKNDALLMDGWTILFHACKYGTLDIVKFLLKRGDNVNKQIDSTTPLMLACQNKTEDVIEIIKHLLINGAVLNISDNYGKTPLMFAIGNGLTEAVQIFIKNASLESTDNDGWTALFHAVESNRFDCVKLMIEAGVDISSCNRRGYTPKQVAESYGFQDIYDLFPKTDKELEFQIPTNHICYSEYKDLVPTVFNDETPAYFPDIYSMLYGMRCENYSTLFYQANISLEDFLSITDDKLVEMGIKFPFQRKRILLGLYLFHSHPWAKRTVSKIGLTDKINIYDYYQLVASHLRQFIVLKAGINFLQKNFVSPELQIHTKINEIFMLVRILKRTVEMTNKRIVYLQKFNPPKPVLHIDSKYLLQIKKSKFTFATFSKYSAYLGMGALIVYGLKKQLFK